jgi:uncharacterized membrane protein
MDKKQSRILLYLILLFGFILRIEDIGEEPVWVDAHYTMDMTNQQLLDVIVEVSKTDVHPPLHYASVRIWRVFAGSEPVTLRLFSVIWGILCIYLIYRLGLYLFNNKVGLLSAFLLAISPMFIFHSQNMRMYSMFTALLILSTEMFFRYKDEKSNKYMILYILCSVLLLYTHVYAFFLMISHGIIILYEIYKNRNAFFSWFKPVISIFIVMTPWITILVSRLLQSDSTAPNWIENIAPSTSEIIAQAIIGVGLWFVRHALFGAVFLLVLAYLLVSRIIKNKTIIYLTIMILTPVILSPTISILYETITFQRYFIPWGCLSYIMISYAVFPNKNSNPFIEGKDILYANYRLIFSDNESQDKFNKSGNYEISGLPFERIALIITVLLFMIPAGLTVTETVDRPPWDEVVNTVESGSEDNYKILVRGYSYNVLEHNLRISTVEPDGEIIDPSKNSQCTQIQTWYLVNNPDGTLDVPENASDITWYGQLKLYSYPNGTC